MNDPNAELSLAGAWEYRLDPEEVGLSEKWFEACPVEGSIILPGSLDTNGIGMPDPRPDYMGGLTRKVRYVGPAWYFRTIDLPEELRGTELELELERVHWFSRVWCNGQELGAQDSLSVPHRHRFHPEGAAQIKLAIRVDNAPHIPIGRIGHSLTDWTQTNWNGVIGRMSIGAVEGSLVLNVVPAGDGLVVRGSASPLAKIEIEALGQTHTVQAEVDGAFHLLLPAEGLPAWSDDAPALFEVSARSGDQVAKVRTGFRGFRAEGRRLLLNGEPVFLRGTLEACVFPKTGYPHMNSDGWSRVYAQAKAFGLNHIRFHSWCPPRAAFEAADEMGLLLQVELPLWTGKWAMSSDPALMDFCRREAFRILEEYGAHPSFVLFTLGNEMAFYGEEPEVDRLLRDLKAAFPHILFNFSSHGTHLSPECDYYVQADNGKPGPENRPLRGSTWFGVGSRFDREPPATLTTCDEASSLFDRPVIAHEVAEWAVFPGIADEPDYDGVLEARNFAMIRRMLEARGMGDQAAAFTQASGRLSAELYKEEIETLLRTKDLAGYQLLGLTDFPGQGTATIGMLDAFWREKGFISAEEFREFCASTVPLMVCEKRSWCADEVLTADVLAFHSGPARRAGGRWELVASEGCVVAHGELAPVDLVPGVAVPLGSVRIPLAGLPTPARYELRAELDGGFRNRWALWSFEREPEAQDLPNVDIFGWYREDVRTALKAGRSVWLRLHPDQVWTGIPGRFAPAFWSPIHFKEQVGTMGTLIREGHPIFAQFPTAGHTDWQWWDILTRSKAAILDALPPGYRPELQVIDRYERNHKLGTLFELSIGEGQVLVSFIDFDTSGRPAARQLEASIRHHLASGRRPDQSATLAELDAVFEVEP